MASAATSQPSIGKVWLDARTPADSGLGAKDGVAVSGEGAVPEAPDVGEGAAGGDEGSGCGDAWAFGAATGGAAAVCTCFGLAGSAVALRVRDDGCGAGADSGCRVGGAAVTAAG